MKLMPGKPNVAVFDTAFHQSMPAKAFMYPLPYEDYTELKVRKYGFHGTSHLYVSQTMREIMGNPEHSKIIVCHLGNGSSMSDRKSTRLNSSHANISYAVFCLKKKKQTAI